MQTPLKKKPASVMELIALLWNQANDPLMCWAWHSKTTVFMSSEWLGQRFILLYPAKQWSVCKCNVIRSKLVVYDFIHRAAHMYTLYSVQYVCTLHMPLIFMQVSSLCTGMCTFIHKHACIWICNAECAHIMSKAKWDNDEVWTMDMYVCIFAVAVQ